MTTSRPTLAAISEAATDLAESFLCDAVVVSEAQLFPGSSILGEDGDRFYVTPQFVASLEGKSHLIELKFATLVPERYSVVIGGYVFFDKECVDVAELIDQFFPADASYDYAPCPRCSGSGEGDHDGALCGACGGSGEAK